nr:MAG TPA: hypothetical protein [Caudoviricetes sp.]
MIAEAMVKGDIPMEKVLRMVEEEPTTCTISSSMPTATT